MPAKRVAALFSWQKVYIVANVITHSDIDAFYRIEEKRPF
jgi:hypothetical protein